MVDLVTLSWWRLQWLICLARVVLRNGIKCNWILYFKYKSFILVFYEFRLVLVHFRSFFIAFLRPWPFYRSIDSWILLKVAVFCYFQWTFWIHDIHDLNKGEKMRLETLLASTFLTRRRASTLQILKKFRRLTDDRITLTACVFSNTGSWR